MWGLAPRRLLLRRGALRDGAGPYRRRLAEVTVLGLEAMLAAGYRKGQN
jgi:hypothetical protein